MISLFNTSFAVRPVFDRSIMQYDFYVLRNFFSSGTTLLCPNMQYDFSFPLFLTLVYLFARSLCRSFPPFHIVILSMFLYVYPFKVLLYIYMYIYFHPKSSNWFCLLPNPIYLEFCEYDIV